MRLNEADKIFRGRSLIFNRRNGACNCQVLSLEQLLLKSFILHVAHPVSSTPSLLVIPRKLVKCVHDIGKFAATAEDCLHACLFQGLDIEWSNNSP